MDRVEVITRVERRRKWTDAEKAVVLAETDAPGTNVAAVARKHGIARSVVYNWRSARRAQAIAAMPGAGPVEFIPLGVVGGIVKDEPAVSPGPVSAATRSAGDSPSPGAERSGMIEVELPNGARLRVDGLVNECALCRVLRALKSLG
jgi:transposase